MATKNKTIFVKIKPQFCKVELLNVLQTVTQVVKSDTEKGIYLCTYSYYYQKVKVKVSVRPEKDLSAIYIEGSTDDLIGTGAKKAIAKIEEEITAREGDFKIDFEIDEAYLKILKRSYNDYDFLFLAKEKRPGNFKVFHGLALCYLNMKDEKSAHDHFEKAISLIPSNKHPQFRKNLAIDLFKLKAFKLSALLHDPNFQDDSENSNTVFFHLILELNSGNITKTLQILVCNFQSHPDFTKRLLKEKSVLVDKKYLLQKYIPTLIKAVRNNIKFNSQPESLKYLVSNKKREEALIYQKSLVAFYETKNISFNQFLSLYQNVLRTGKILDLKAIEVLLLVNQGNFSIYKNLIKSLNIIFKPSNNQILVKDLNELAQRINENLEKLESGHQFSQIKPEIHNSDELRMEIESFLKQFQTELLRRIDHLIRMKKPHEASQTILLFTEIYGTPPAEKASYMEKITQQKRELEKSRKQKRALKVGAAVLVVFAAIIYLYPKFSSAEEPGKAANVEMVSSDVETTIEDGITEEEVIEEISEPIPVEPINLSWHFTDQLKEKFHNYLNSNQDVPEHTILLFLEEYNTLVKTLNTELYDLENYDELSSLEWNNKEEWLNLKDFLYQKGLDTDHSEGMLYLTPNTDFIRSSFAGLNDRITQKFIDLYCKEYEEKCCDDAAIMLSETELVNRIYQWGELTEGEEYSAYEEMAQKEFKFYLWTAFKGMDNTPSFDYDSGKFNENIFIEMNNIVSKHPNSRASKAFRPYLALLQQEGFEETPAVSNYLSSLSPYN